MATAIVPAVAAAQSSNVDRELRDQIRTIVIPRVSRPPTLDDVANGTEPPELALIADFRQQRPADGSPVSRETAAYVGYDADNLYVVFRCRERPGKVRARMSRRDDIFSDDSVALYLDTFRDHQHAVSFYANPLGIQADSVNTEGQGDDYSYDAVWRSEGRVTPDGYIVSMAIPFKSIRFPDAGAPTWGFGVARFIPDNNESSYWPYYTTRIEGFAPQLGTVEGLERIAHGRNVQLIPYAALDGSRQIDTPEGADSRFQTGAGHRAGLDSKVILHDALALDVTINPDFSQVESNDPQVTTNQRFEVFFPEKRPFFLENASYFQTPENLFFSRRIENPEAGARLTGSTGPWQLGVLGTDDRSPGSQRQNDDPLQGSHAAIGAARVQRQFGKQSTVGLLATGYRFGGDSEVVLSADTRLKLTPNLVVTGQAARSEARGPDATRVAGTDYYGELAYSDLHVGAATKYSDRSPGFDARLGFIPRVDVRLIQEDASYKWLPAAPLLKSFGPTVTLARDWDHQGRVQDWVASPGFAVELAGQTTVALVRTEAVEVFDDIRFRRHWTGIEVGTEASKEIGVHASYGAGEKVNYYPPAGLLPFAAAGQDLSLTLTLRPVARLKMTETYLFSHLRTLDGAAAILSDHRFRSTVNYQFTKALSVRAIVDYAGARPDTGLLDLERSKALTGDFLLTYLVNPGTALYVGYTNQREDVATAPGNPFGAGGVERAGTITARRVFMKLSYLFRL